MGWPNTRERMGQFSVMIPAVYAQWVIGMARGQQGWQGLAKRVPGSATGSSELTAVGHLRRGCDKG
jgi:hypothetical protein